MPSASRRVDGPRPLAAIPVGFFVAQSFASRHQAAGERFSKRYYTRVKWRAKLAQLLMDIVEKVGTSFRRDSTTMNGEDEEEKLFEPALAGGGTIRCEAL